MENQNSGGENGSNPRKDLGTIVHNQVRRIKQEDGKVDDQSPPAMMEVRPIIRELTRQLSPSPLSRMSQQPIYVGD